eukprot:TRINITY_DN12925_c0_g1_i2.p1 TRINITY_DN12925_c0_g1~~TRINITY_DN12925_c0_g1_i2.p1  ORF type:complete len:275 (-),score=80.31 TRINITY_DN12925_c0_g1_i2:303-1127(-)
MEVFDKKNQLHISDQTDNYFQYTLSPDTDLARVSLNLPLSVPIFKLAYAVDGVRHYINIYPTLQFLYSHHIQAEYINDEVRAILTSYKDPAAHCKQFLASVQQNAEEDLSTQHLTEAEGLPQLDCEVLINHIKQNPHYTLAALRQGVYIIGMKDQFNVHDIGNQPLHEEVQYIADEMGFVLHDRTNQRDIDEFGPYFIEQYILMEVLSKQEVAQNVMEYFVNQKHKLRQGVQNYNEAQGKGFICWRFINDHVNRSAPQSAATEPAEAESAESEL